MKTERELFEDFYKSTDSLYHKALSNYDAEFDAYQNDYIQCRYFYWQASVNRDGFVLAPVEPTEKIDAIIDLCNNSRGSIHWEVDSFIEGIEEILK